MECSDKTNLYINDIAVDQWGGEVQLIDVAADLQSIMVNIETPWGATYSAIEIDKGTSKIYTSDEKTYSVEMTLAGYVSGNYIGQIVICYEFVEKINTTLSMVYDSDASQTIEGEKLFFDVLLKDQNDNILNNFDVGLYTNNIHIIDVSGDCRYEHIITADEVGQELVFQVKFDGTAGFNPSQSSTISIEIPTPSTTGSLVCTSIPTGAEIRINGNDSGYLTPKTFINMDIGNHVITFRKEGYIECSKSVTVVADQQAEVFCELSTVLKCTQNIKIQDQNYYPVTGVNVEMNNVTEITNSNGLVSFTDITRNIDYTVNKSYGDYTGEDIITGCKLDPQILHIIVPEKPKCIDFTTQAECEDNGCYWHSDNTCQSMPDGTTEYFDIHIKPYPFYNGEYEEAISKTLEKVVELTGAIANYMSGITGYEYKGIDILEDENKQVIIVRVYLKDTNETALVAPVVVAAIAVIIAGILLLSIGYIVGTSDGEFTKEEVIELIDNASDKAIEECKDRYPNRTTDVNAAADFKHCVGGIETVRIIGSGDVVEKDSSEHIDYVINPTIVELDEKLDDGTLLPEDIDAAINDNLTVPTKEVVDDYKQEAIDDECAFEIAGTCIITKKALKTLAVVGLGIGGLVALSAAKDITKK